MFYLERHNTVSDAVLTAEEAHTTGHVRDTNRYTNIHIV